MPIPDESVPFEDIVSFRNDHDTISKLFSLRNWMNEIAKAKLTYHEIEDKCQVLINDYEKHMRLNKMKYRYGVIESLITVGPEFLENLVKIKWGKAAKNLFSFKHNRIRLLEAELKAPGSEIAFIVKAKEEFQ